MNYIVTIVPPAPHPPKFWDLPSSLNREEGWFFHKEEELGGQSTNYVVIFLQYTFFS